jgi:hypothetical protein
MPQMSKRLKGQGPISAHYGKKAPCRAHLPMLALVVEARSSANAQWFWVHRAARGGRVQGLNSIGSSRSQLEHGHFWTWRCTEHLWTLAELPTAEWQLMMSCLALCRELITHARRTAGYRYVL